MPNPFDSDSAGDLTRKSRIGTDWSSWHLPARKALSGAARSGRDRWRGRRELTAGRRAKAKPTVRGARNANKSRRNVQVLNRPGSVGPSWVNRAARSSTMAPSIVSARAAVRPHPHSSTRALPRLGLAR